MRNRRSLANVLLVERDFKKTQILRVMGLAAIYVWVSTAVLAFFYVRVLHPEMIGSRGFYWEITDGAAMWRQLPGLGTVLLIWATTMTGLSALFSVGVGLHLSHKLAGPVYRLKKELGRIAEGKPIRPVVLRDGDDFQDLADSLNFALRRLERDEALPADDAHGETRRALRETLERFETASLVEGDRGKVERLRETLLQLLAKDEGESAA